MAKKKVQSTPDCGPIGWKSLVVAATAPGDKKQQAEQSLANEVKKRIESLDLSKLSSHATFQLFSIADLNSKVLPDLDVASSTASEALLSLNNVINLAPGTLALVLAEHGTLENLAKLYRRAADMTSPVSHMVMLVVYAIAARTEQSGLVELVASKQDIMDLLLGTLVFMAGQPQHLMTEAGLMSFIRAVRITWGATRYNAPACRRALEYCKAADIPGRLLQALQWDPEAYGLDLAQPSSSTPGASLGALYVNLHTTGVSFLASLQGIGGRMALDHVSLASHRQWLLREGSLKGLRRVLDVLLDVLHSGGRHHHLSPPEGPPGDLRHVDGALRNCLLLLGIPVVAVAHQRQEVTSAMTFSLRYYYALFQLGYVDVLRQLQALAQQDARSAPASADAAATATATVTAKAGTGTSGAEAAAAGAGAGAGTAASGAEAAGSAPANGKAGSGKSGTGAGAAPAGGAAGQQHEEQKEQEGSGEQAATKQQGGENAASVANGTSDGTDAINGTSSSSSGGGYESEYRAFFAAFAGILQEGILAVGPTFAAWDVSFSVQDDVQSWRPQAEGVDLSTASAFIAQQVKPALNWSDRMLVALKLAALGPKAARG